MRSGLEYADIVKVSDDEVELLTGKAGFQQGAEELVRNGAKLAIVTAGEHGAWYASVSGFCGHIPSFKVNVVDTTGAGDTFLGALLNKVLEQENRLENISETALQESIRFANAAGALCTTGFGAIASMPSEQQIEEFLTREMLQIH